MNFNYLQRRKFAEKAMPACRDFNPDLHDHRCSVLTMSNWASKLNCQSTDQFNDQLTAGVLAQLVRALHRYRRGKDLNLGNCVSCVFNYDDLFCIYEINTVYLFDISKHRGGQPRPHPSLNKWNSDPELLIKLITWNDQHTYNFYNNRYNFISNLNSSAGWFKR